MSKENNKDVIFPAAYALQALKFTAYNNTAYALSEVVDNSFEANAKNIHVAIVCGKGEENPSTIAILDDGKGMDNDALRRAIQYGNGSHAGKHVSQIKGLGRFGVGLLSATFNQCESLEIWSWQNGINLGDIAPKIELNVPSISEEGGNFLPNPKNESLPEFYDKVFASFPEIQNNLPTGTLVVWRNFHNLTWKKASTLSRHLAFECGRIYRNFIAEGKINIVLSIWDADFKPIKPKDSFVGAVGVVDPMFLRAWDDRGLQRERYSLGYFRDKPMFIPFSNVHGDDCRDEAGNVTPITYSVKDEKGNVQGTYRILASYRSPEVIQEAGRISSPQSDPGSTPFGRMARHLQGVSILRAGREIMLDPRWLRADLTIDRWIAVSIDFDPSLDEFFGVANNKQSASYLSELSRFRLSEEDDLKEVAKTQVVLKVAQDIHRILSDMRKIINKERRGVRSESAGSSEGMSPEFTLPGQLIEMQGKFAGSGATSPIPSDIGNPDDDMESLVQGYKDSIFENEPADKVRPPEIKKHGIRSDIVAESEQSAAFFKVVQTPSVMIVKLNQDHPMYSRMSDILHPSNKEDEEDPSWQERQGKNAVWLIKRLLFCYARAECEASGRKKGEFESVRLEWGRIAQIVMEDEEDD